MPPHPDVRLRPLVQDDLPLPPDHSWFSDYGPAHPLREVPPCDLEGQGTLAIEADGQLVGVTGWHWRDWGPRNPARAVMIGISVTGGQRGQGIGTRAQQQLVDLVFRHTGAHRVEAGTLVENHAERSALEKAGFSLEGVIRESHWLDGRMRDQCLYAVLRPEWEEQRPE